MTGVIDSKGDFHNLYFYKIQELCEVMVNTAILDSDDLKIKYETEYKGKITRFSSEVEFCLHELGWMIYDPFCQERDEVLFSNGNRCYVASTKYVKKVGFDRKKVNNDKIGFPLLTDEAIDYQEDLANIDKINEGIVDERGFISAKFLPNMNDLASIVLMFDLIKNEEKYNDYINHKDEYANALEYLTSKKNVISIKKLENGTFALEFVSENDGKVQSFIDNLEKMNKVAELVPLVLDEPSVGLKVV